MQTTEKTHLRFVEAKLLANYKMSVPPLHQLLKLLYLHLSDVVGIEIPKRTIATRNGT